MSYIFRLSDEEYTQLAAYAARRKQTPEKLFQAWLNDVTHTMETSTSSNHIDQRDREVQAIGEQEALNSPLFQVAGMFAIGEPGWADRHDEYLAEAHIENHANND